MSAVPIRRTSRDHHELASALAHWLAAKVGEPVAVSDLSGTDANGMSSDTVLFRASWGRHDEPLVARISPAAEDVPVFPSYDMVGQFTVLQMVRALTQVPVPEAMWCEPSGDAVGAPMFVMKRVDGVVPPDVMPYPFGDNWLYDATSAQQRRLQDTTVAAIAGLHAIDDAPGRFAFLERPDHGATHLRRHVAHTKAWWEFIAATGPTSPLIHRAFGWLDDNWPAHESEPVLSWGDARIGNVIYSDFAPAALLDWEMAGIGPRELDVAWLIYAHRIFQELSDAVGLAGMPAFLKAEDVAAHYEALTGTTPRDLEWFMTYAATQWAIVFMRTGQRQAHFGERSLPADPEELIYHRASLEAMLAHPRVA